MSYNTAIGIRVAATGQAVARSVGARLYGYVINVTTGQYVLRDGGASGTIKWDTQGVAGQVVMFKVPIWFKDGLHVTIPASGDLTLLVDPA